MLFPSTKAIARCSVGRRGSCEGDVRTSTPLGAGTTVPRPAIANGTTHPRPHVGVGSPGGEVITRVVHGSVGVES